MEWNAMKNVIGYHFWDWRGFPAVCMVIGGKNIVNNVSPEIIIYCLLQYLIYLFLSAKKQENAYLNICTSLCITKTTNKVVVGR